MTTEAQRPLPRFPEPDTEPFWRATRQHELRYPVCTRCGGVVFYPRRHCTHCLSLDLEWRTSRGEGTVYTFSVIRQNRHPAFAPRVPYVVAYVDLDEGFRLLTNVVGVDPAAVRIGQRVRVDWEDYEELALPVFRPV
jgi:uncharacterized OB-fold protein